MLTRNDCHKVIHFEAIAKIVKFRLWPWKWRPRISSVWLKFDALTPLVDSERLPKGTALSSAVTTELRKQWYSPSLTVKLKVKRTLTILLMFNSRMSHVDLHMRSHYGALMHTAVAHLLQNQWIPKVWPWKGFGTKFVDKHLSTRIRNNIFKSNNPGLGWIFIQPNTKLEWIF